MSKTANLAGEQNLSARIFTDPVRASVLANRLESIVREMTNTVLRTARSAIISSGRDFSCSLVTADNQLLAVADGLPVHTFSSHLQAASMTRLHDDLAEGDAFIHNDPYLGNTHAADQSILVPVFVEGEHLFTALVKAHQADIGNSIPSTYHPFARDLYEEGAVVFPCMRVERGYKTNEDIIRMCMRRIRVPEQWRGDFLATLGAARIAERRLKELCARYGVDQIKTFVREWFEYSETLMASRIAKLPAAELSNSASHDPVGDILPEGIPLSVKIKVLPEEGRIEVDMRDNINSVRAGFNQSEATAVNNAMTGIYNILGAGIPRNSGAFRRVTIKLREGSVAGIPEFPASCSLATTNVGDRIVNMVQSAFAQLGLGYGLAEGGLSMGVGSGTISGHDYRYGNRPYINSMSLGANGGPAGPHSDGWQTYALPVCSGLTHKDSIEICEPKFPVLIESNVLIPGSGGAGQNCGALQGETAYRVRQGNMTVVLVSDGQHFAPKGVLGGHPGGIGESWLLGPGDTRRKLDNFAVVPVSSEQVIVGRANGGGGYGNPLDRPAERVLADVLAERETIDRAETIYGVALVASGPGEIKIDAARTQSLRAQRT